MWVIDDNWGSRGRALEVGQVKPQGHGGRREPQGAGGILRFREDALGLGREQREPQGVRGREGSLEWERMGGGILTFQSSRALLV